MGAKVCSKSMNTTKKKTLNLKKKSDINQIGLSIIDNEVINSRRNSRLSNKDDHLLLVDMNNLLQHYKFSKSYILNFFFFFYFSKF
jgi:hypothetical protein